MDQREEILRVLVNLEDVMAVEGTVRDVIMISFSGEAQGPYFNGRILPHGVDTQKRKKGGKTKLSARYMLEGTDDTQTPCHIFIENNGVEEPDGVMRLHPEISTDSASLAWMEEEPLTGTVEGAGEGKVIIRIYRQNGI